MAEPKGEEQRETGDMNGDVWDDLVLDENFIRSAETAEPSARARMLAARWRDGGPDPQPWRSDEPPAGWFFSKGQPAQVAPPLTSVLFSGAQVGVRAQ